jgi:hypothetical protein
VFCAGTECNAGEVADLQHAFGGPDLNVHSATLNGITYHEVNTLGAEAFATIGFSSTHLLPALSSTAVLTTPFMMQGSFSHPGGVETPVGTGVVTTRWLSAPARLRRRGTSNLPAMSSRRRLPCRNRAHSCLSRPALPQLR